MQYTTPSRIRSQSSSLPTKASLSCYRTVITKVGQTQRVLSLLLVKTSLPPPLLNKGKFTEMQGAVPGDQSNGTQEPKHMEAGTEG